jgi:hypothetical protein
VPLWYLGYDVPLVPIHMNCINPPVPTPEDCVHFGKVLRRVVRELLPATMRVALIGTGGLSHEPGGPRYFTLDENFDRWFLDLMAESDEGRVVKEATVERMNEAGGGGTTELLAWMVAMAAAGGAPGRSTFYNGVGVFSLGKWIPVFRKVTVFVFRRQMTIRSWLARVRSTSQTDARVDASLIWIKVLTIA